MFRPLFRRPRTVSVPKENGTIGVQRVEVSRKPRTGITRTIVNAVLFYCAYRTVVLWVYGPDPEVQKKVEELRKEQQKGKSKPKPSDHWKEQHEAFAKAKAFGQGEGGQGKPSVEDEDTVTIPIPGWIKELDRKPYKADSPEVRAFMAFKQDEKATRRLYEAFDAAVTKQIEGSRSHLTALKYIDYTGDTLRDINVQTMLFHPATYAIRCIVIKPNGDVGLTWKEMSPATGTRMEKMLHPVILSKAFLAGVWAFSTTTAALTRAKILDIVYPARDYDFVIRHVKLKQWTFLHSITVRHSLSYEDQVISKLPSSSLSPKLAQHRFPFLKGDLEKDSNKEAIRSHIRSVTHEHALQHSVDMFKRSWAQGQLKAQRSTTPGAVSIIGFYDFHGKNGRYRVEIFGRYLPSEEVFIGPVQITKGYILSDVAKPKNTANTIKQARVPERPEIEAKGEVTVAAEKPKPKLKHVADTSEPPKSGNTPEASGKSSSAEKEAEKKAEE